MTPEGSGSGYSAVSVPWFSSGCFHSEIGRAKGWKVYRVNTWSGKPKRKGYRASFFRSYPGGGIYPRTLSAGSDGRVGKFWLSTLG